MLCLLDDLQEQPSEDCHMPADEEDLVFISPRKLSSNNSIRSQGSPAKGLVLNATFNNMYLKFKTQIMIDKVTAKDKNKLNQW